MLGTAVVNHFSRNHEVFATDVVKGVDPGNVVWKCIDLLDNKAISEWLTYVKPEVVVHCAALVNVDLCEKKPELAYALHVGVAEYLAQVVSGWNGIVVYISTDSVFDGRKPGAYVEADPVNPLNVYAQTKYEAEKHILAIPNGVVLRTNIFGWSRSDAVSFAEWVLKGLVLGEKRTMFSDVLYTPIHVCHLAECIERVLIEKVSGLYHATGSDILSKYEFAKRVAEIFGLSGNSIVSVSVDESHLTACRPKNMALDNRSLCNAIRWRIPGVGTGIHLMKEHYDSGWLSTIKQRAVGEDYHFWEE